MFVFSSANGLHMDFVEVPGRCGWDGDPYHTEKNVPLPYFHNFSLASKKDSHVSCSVMCFISWPLSLAASRCEERNAPCGFVEEDSGRRQKPQNEASVFQ